MTGSDDSERGSEYAEYVAQLLAGQEARKASLEQRGLSVVTSSGTLVTLLFGLVALLTKGASYRLPTKTHGWLATSLTLFVIAAVLGVFTNLPLRYTNVDFDDPDVLLDRWEDTPADARLRISATRLDEFKRAQRLNRGKAWLLVCAMAAEVGATLPLAVAIAFVLTNA
jgi:hypothetical protein